MTGASGELLNSYWYSCTDFTLGLNSIIHYSFARNLSLGTGIGGQILQLSLPRLPDFGMPDTKKYATNHFYKPLMPVIPVEVSFKLKKYLLTVRYEKGLLNRYKDLLGQYKKEKFGLLYFEMGFLL